MSAASSDRGERARLTRRAALAGLTVAMILLFLKARAAWTSESMAMLSSLADTVFDLAGSSVTLFAVWLAALPADHEHRFGHGKAESIAALVQGGMIAVSAVVITWQAIGRLAGGATAGPADEAIAVSVVAIAATSLLVLYQKSVAQRTQSPAIHADRLHYQGDLLLNLAVIAAVILESRAGLRGADPLFAIAIAGWLLRGSWRASLRGIDQLMDREWPEEKRRRFLAVAARHPAGRGIHDFRTRSSGGNEFAQFHIWLDREMSVAKMHDVVEEIEIALAGEFPGVEVLIHVDPEGQVDQPGNLLVEADETRNLRKGFEE